MRRVAVVLLAVAVLAACESSTPDAHWYGSGERVVHVRIDPSVGDPLVVLAVQDAIADWSAGVDRLRFEFGWGPCLVGEHCVRVLQEQGAFAHALVGWNTELHMTGIAGAVVFGYIDWDWATLLNVACHELGHFVALGHSPYEGVQGPCVDGNPTAYDLQLANSMYAHDD